MNSVQLNNHQLEALANDATALLFVAKDGVHPTIMDLFIETYSPLQPNQEYYVQEDYDMGNHYTFEDRVIYRADQMEDGGVWLDASTMSKSESRYKFTVKSVEVKRLSELDIEDWIQLYGDTDWVAQIDEQHGQGTYTKNPYCFYAVIEKD